jgi:hypothetical protein
MCGSGLNVLASGAKTMLGVDAAGKEAAFNLQEDQENIRLSQYAEQDAVARGAEAEGASRIEGTKLADEQAFLYANSGVDASVGTAANVVASTRMQSEKDALTIRNNAAREAWGQSKTTERLRRQKDVNLQRSGDKLNATILGGLADGVSAGSK